MSALMQLYRERNGEPGFWAEPTNALTNASFLAAAVAAWLLARRRQCLTAGTSTLILEALLIAAGSFVFHTCPTNVTRWMDIIPIALFQMTFMWLCCRHMFNLSSAISIFAIALVMGSAWLLMKSNLLNGSLGYSPALLSLVVFASAHLSHRAQEPWTLMVAVGVFIVAIVARSIDWLVPFSLGTHFLWHLLNGLVVYLVMRIWVLHIAKDSDQHPRP